MSATGWTNFGGQANKWHFIGQDGRSLCRKWLVWARHELQQDNDSSPDNCAECKRRVAKRTAAVSEGKE